jgi:hypothetical protein
MIFIAHFSVEKIDSRGNFTMLVSASNSDQAVEKLMEKILDAKESDDVFEDVERIYLDVIYEVDSFSKEPQITRVEYRLPYTPISGSIHKDFEYDNLVPLYMHSIGKDEDGETDVIMPFIEFECASHEVCS